VSDCSPHIANIGRLVEVSGCLPQGLPGGFPPASSSAAPISGPRLVSSAPSEPSSEPEAPPLRPPEDSVWEALSPDPLHRVRVQTGATPRHRPFPTPSGRRGCSAECPPARTNGRPGPGRGLPCTPVWPPRGLQGAGGAGAPDWPPPFQDMENKIRSTLNEIYFGKTKDIVNGLR